jgi:hypothetical protein
MLSSVMGLLDPFFELFKNLEALGILILFCIGAMIVLPIASGLISALGPNADPDIVKTILDVAIDFIKKNPLIDLFAVTCGVVAYWIFKR